MSENEEDKKVEKVFITNANYKDYYDKLAKEEAERNRVDKPVGGILRQGRLSRQLLQSEIEDMQKQAQSAKHCARLLGVSYQPIRSMPKCMGYLRIVRMKQG